MVVRLLLDAFADIEDQDSNGNAPLLLAIQNRDRDMVRRLLRNDLDSRGCTVLMVAASVGDDVIVRILLKEGADAEAFDNDRNRALMLAES